MLPEKTVGAYGSIADVAEHLDVDPLTVRRAIASGKLPAYRLGKRQVRIKWSDVEGLLKPIPVAS